MGDVLGQIGQFGSNLMQGVGDVGGELLQGAQGLFSGSGLEGAAGLAGGGAPGAVANVLPGAASAADAGVDAAAIAPAAGQAASSLMSGPGVLDTSTIASGLPAVTGINANPSGLLGGISDPSLGGAQSISDFTTNPLTSAGMNPVQAITPPDASLAPGIAANPTGLASNWLQRGGNFLQGVLQNPKLLGETGLLGAELLNANRTPPGEAALKDLAGQQARFAQNQSEIAQAEEQGLLPAGAQNMFQGLLNANEAAIRAKYAQMGMTGSSAEMQDLAASRDQIMSMMFQQGQQMAAQGYTNVNQATGYESALLKQILDSETAQGTQLGQALATFAGAAAK